MKVVVSPCFLKGTIHAPASKSAMQRACAAAVIRQGTTVISNPGVSDDDLAALAIIQQLGADVQKVNDQLIIKSAGVNPKSNHIDCGESGLSVRLFSSLAALSDQPIRVTGKGSLLKRPLSFFTEVLPQLGVQCTDNNGLLPLQIKGPLHPANIEVDGSLSSQFLTGLLFAYAAANAKEVTISVRGLNSKPYIDLSLQVLNAFGLPVPENRNYEHFYFSPVQINQVRTEPIHYLVEGDWSGGAFLLVAGAISGDIVVKGLDVFSTQADKAVLQPLMQSGASISVEEDQIHIRKSHLKAFHFNATDAPDLFPPLVALAAFCQGTTVIEGVHRLAHKESNRAITLQQEFGKMGVEIILQDNLMIIKGGGAVTSAVVHSNHDHRIAMACAVAALGAEGSITIEGAEAVNKSYPKFWEHLRYLTPS